MIRHFVAVIAVISLGSIAQARTFDFKKESFAAYFRGTWGTSNAKDSAYGASVNENLTADKTVSSAASGEFGFLFSGNRFGLRLGAEYLLPHSQTEVGFSKDGGAALVNANSELSAIIPKADFEFPAYRTPTSRVIIGIGGGIALVDLENKYTITDAGKATGRFTGFDDYVESGSAQSVMAQTYLGYEFLLTDTVTMTGDVGYRYLKVPSFKSTRKAHAFTGQQEEGDELKNADGGVRSVDMSGFFVGLGFRFYFGG